MTLDYVLDSNIFILLFNDQLDEPIPEGRLGFSVITEIELLSFAGLSDEDGQLIRQQLQVLERLPLDEAVSERAIRLRRRFRLKTPDAIVVASALVADAVLLTNDQQLLGVEGLRARALKMREAR
ncbi:MAG: type II toxin-antitoxin system VapC family toxin [Synechococcales cyanobacterium CRU_2_2]|nr:type II toxin-antitoxin system VapC family toxin [Synechococcales cyanobacterium CRU_2_2]